MTGSQIIVAFSIAYLDVLHAYTCHTQTHTLRTLLTLSSVNQQPGGTFVSWTTLKMTWFLWKNSEGISFGMLLKALDNMYVFKRTKMFFSKTVLFLRQKKKPWRCGLGLKSQYVLPVVPFYFYPSFNALSTLQLC